MKQYLSVVIVFVVCLLAIAIAWGWRISQRDNDDFENLVNDYVNIYNENVKINQNVKIYE